MIIALSLLIALVGVLMYALSANPKLVEIGRICFFCGLPSCSASVSTGLKPSELPRSNGHLPFPLNPSRRH